MNYLCFGEVSAVGILSVAVQGLFSYYDGYFTRKQMLIRHQRGEGKSFLQHGGMWADVFIITPIVAYLASSGYLNYSSVVSGILFACSLVIWGIAAQYFRSLPFPEAHVHDGRITIAGWIHLSYAVLGTWAIAVYYFSRPPLVDLIATSTLLTPFFFLGSFKFGRDWKWSPLVVAMTFGGPVILWSVVVWRLLR